MSLFAYFHNNISIMDWRRFKVKPPADVTTDLRVELCQPPGLCHIHLLYSIFWWFNKGSSKLVTRLFVYFLIHLFSCLVKTIFFYISNWQSGLLNETGWWHTGCHQISHSSSVVWNVDQDNIVAYNVLSWNPNLDANQTFFVQHSHSYLGLKIPPIIHYSWEKFLSAVF